MLSKIFFLLWKKKSCKCVLIQRICFRFVFSMSFLRKFNDHKACQSYPECILFTRNQLISEMAWNLCYIHYQMKKFYSNCYKNPSQISSAQQFYLYCVVIKVFLCNFFCSIDNYRKTFIDNLWFLFWNFCFAFLIKLFQLNFRFSLLLV